eukprot:245568_1
MLLKLMRKMYLQLNQHSVCFPCIIESLKCEMNVHQSSTINHTSFNQFNAPLSHLSQTQTLNMNTFPHIPNMNISSTISYNNYAIPSSQTQTLPYRYTHLHLYHQHMAKSIQLPVNCVHGQTNQAKEPNVYYTPEYIMKYKHMYGSASDNPKLMHALSTIPCITSVDIFDSSGRTNYENSLNSLNQRMMQVDHLKNVIIEFKYDNNKQFNISFKDTAVLHNILMMQQRHTHRHINHTYIDTNALFYKIMKQSMIYAEAGFFLTILKNRLEKLKIWKKICKSGVFRDIGIKTYEVANNRILFYKYWNEYYDFYENDKDLLVPGVTKCFKNFLASGKKPIKIRKSKPLQPFQFIDYKKIQDSNTSSGNDSVQKRAHQQIDNSLNLNVHTSKPPNKKRKISEMSDPTSDEIIIENSLSTMIDAIRRQKNVSIKNRLLDKIMITLQNEIAVDAPKGSLSSNNNVNYNENLNNKNQLLDPSIVNTIVKKTTFDNRNTNGNGNNNTNESDINILNDNLNETNKRIMILNDNINVKFCPKCSVKVI